MRWASPQACWVVATGPASKADKIGWDHLPGRITNFESANAGTFVSSWLLALGRGAPLMSRVFGVTYGPYTCYPKGICNDSDSVDNATVGSSREQSKAEALEQGPFLHVTCHKEQILRVQLLRGSEAS